MSWHSICLNPKAISALYSIAPSLNAIRVAHLHLSQDGPCVTLTIDEVPFPDRPPSKWLQQNFDALILELVGIGVGRLRIMRWGTVNRASIEVASASSGIHIMVSGEECEIEFDCDALRIGTFTPYQRVGDDSCHHF